MRTRARAQLFNARFICMSLSAQMGWSPAAVRHVVGAEL